MPSVHRPAAPLAAIALAACSSLGGGLENGQLKPCPSAPHCVSSEAMDERHAIQPLWPVDRSPQTWQRIVDAVRAMDRTTVVESGAHYLHAEVVTPSGLFTDDLELVQLATCGCVEVRSSSRTGYYDFNVNRERVEALRVRLAALGLLQR